MEAVLCNEGASAPRQSQVTPPDTPYSKISSIRTGKDDLLFFLSGNLIAWSSRGKSKGQAENLALSTLFVDLHFKYINSRQRYIESECFEQPVPKSNPAVEKVYAELEIKAINVILDQFGGAA